jgi:hypothetical protein
MFRTPIAVCVLMISMSAVTGCGGASIRQVALREAELHLVGKHPKVIRVETAQDAAGANLAVAIVHGNFRLPASCGLATGRCRPQQTHYFTVAFSRDHPDSWSAETTSAAELDAVAHARQSRPLFSIFPDFASFSIRCAIPRAGPHPAAIPGLCHTTYETLNHVRVVEFGEKWPLASLPSSGYGPHETSARWIVTLSPSGHIDSIRVTGDQPPQQWK